MQTLVRGHVLSHAEDPPLHDGAILIEDGRVSVVDTWASLSSLETRPDVRVRDHHAHWLVPGMIDVHVHLTLPGDGQREDLFYARSSEAGLLIMAEQNAMAALAAGVTTMRDCGGRLSVVLGLRDAIRSRMIHGPRLFVAGPPMTITGGHCGYMGGEIDGVEAIRIFCRYLRKQGVDYLKMMGSGGGTPGTEHLRTTFSVAEIRAAHEEAQRAGTHLAVHATNPDAVRTVLEAGVDTIEHAILTAHRTDTEYDPALIDAVAASGAIVSPTLPASLGTVRHLETQDRAGLLGSREKSEIPVRQQYLRCRTQQCVDMLAAGVPVASSTDAGWRITFFGDFVDALELLTEAGVGARDVYRTATEVPARALQRADLGNLRKGSLADILVLDGNPLDDIGALRNVKHVYVGGEDGTEKARPIRYET